jgi:hypothetical protein
VGSRPRVVAQPDAEVLDLERLPLADLLDRDNLAGGLLELPQLAEEVPEPEGADKFSSQVLFANETNLDLATIGSVAKILIR